MPTFEYQAVNQTGERISGTVLGASIEQAVVSLSQSGLKVESITGRADAIADPTTPPNSDGNFSSSPQPPSSRTSHHEDGGVRPPPVDPRSYVATSVVGPLVGKVPLSALAFFYRQLSTMMAAGVPIVQSLDTLKRQARSPKLGHVITEIKGHVEAGRPIAAGMQRYPEVFSPLALSMVRAGEEGGILPESLKTLADYTDQEIALRNLIRRLTFYPKLTLIGSMIVILGANALIASLGKSGGIWSPLTTPTTWIWLGPLIIGIFLYVRIGLANPRVKYNWDRLLLMVPYVGNTVKQFCMAKFGRAFGALYRGGVPVHRGIELAADACGNEYLRAQIVPAARRLESGAGITDTLEGSGAFSPIVLDMLATGETTGNVDGMLTRMSDFYEDEAKTRAEQAAHVFGVVVAILVAIYVLIVLVQFYSGYFGGVFQAGAGEE